MKVGDYVRTKDYLDNQLISKIKEIYDDDCVETDKGYWDNEHIIKSSPNIIDLIEVGDYVNGKKVLDVAIDYIFDYSEEIKIVYFDIDKKDYIYSKVDIKSILTKEQFESMEYKV